MTYLARHGETASNRMRRYAGRSAEPLTLAGREQVRELAARLASCGVTAIWSSRIARASESAAIIAEALGIPVSADARLDEMRMGPWEGLTEDEVATRYPTEYGLWNTRPELLALEGRESLEALAERVMGAVRDAWRQPAPVLLVTHVAPMRVAALRTLGSSLARYKDVHVPNAGCLVARDGAAAGAWRLGAGDSLCEELQGSGVFQADAALSEGARQSCERGS